MNKKSIKRSSKRRNKCKGTGAPRSKNTVRTAQNEMLTTTNPEQSECHRLSVLSSCPRRQRQEQSPKLIKVHLVLLIVRLGRVVLVKQVSGGLVGSPVVRREVFFLMYIKARYS